MEPNLELLKALTTIRDYCKNQDCSECQIRRGYDDCMLCDNDLAPEDWDLVDESPVPRLFL